MNYREDSLLNVKISIITASFNSAQTIEKTILSIINQTCCNYEYIIIDGGSTDGTVDIIKKYQDKIAYWISEPDKGISDAWNKGLEHATGDYVGFIGADDLYEPDAVANIIKAFENHPEAGFVFGNIFIEEEDGTKIKYYGDQNYEINLVHDMTIPHLSVFVKKELFENYGYFDTNYHMAMDHEFLLRIYDKGIRGHYVNAFIGTMVLGGVSNNNYIQCYQEIAKTSRKYGKKNVISSYIWLFLKIIKTWLRKVLERLGLKSLIKFYRSIFNKQIKELD